MTFDEIAKKKVVGVPVLYLAGGFVVILAVVAWRMKSTVSDSDAGSTPVEDIEAESSNAGNLAGMDSPYDGLNSNGTVVVQPTTPVAAEPVEETNDTWLRAAIDYIVDAKIASPGDAQSALSKYLDGDDLSFAEGEIRNAAVSKLKTPPEGVAKLGITAAAPAQRQGSSFPVKHTVKGPNDNTPMKLAGLYYGSADWTHANFIASKNTTLGPPATTYSPGTVVTVPAYETPVYVVTTAAMNTFAKVAAKNGTTAAAVFALNPTWTEPFNVNAKVRVR